MAFPLISAGIYAYPIEQALGVAVDAISADLLEAGDLAVYLALYDRKAIEIGQAQFREFFAGEAEYPGDSL